MEINSSPQHVHQRYFHNVAVTTAIELNIDRPQNSQSYETGNK
jgi:hypothetical protein